MPESIAAAARTIQNVCFSLYPPDLLAIMTGTPATPPEAVRDDPARQMKYLTAEKKAAQGLFYPSSLDDILPGLMTEVRPGRSFLDLGSGDGRVVFIAAILGAQATGIEFDPPMHEIARAARKELKATVPKERVTLLKGDFYELDWSKYDVLFYFGSGTFDEPRMLAKLRKEMRPDAVLVLAHVPEAPEGFLALGQYGVVRTWQRDPQDLPESVAPAHPDRPR
ncbi:MAG TPA: class I SAM-dependent methyltransferase [Candidatus Polarisedimenticolia bacterium]|nr:class I SAM-dependent methyltransferase [Candidatus Polarisedimenticolia bacterium]